MQLDLEHLEGWVEVAHPHATDRAERLARLRELVTDPDWRAARIVAVRNGQVYALTWLFDTDPGRVGIGAPRTRGGTPLTDADTIVVDEALQAARARGAAGVTMRLPVERWTGAVDRLLARTGGQEFGGRIEYKTPLDELPADSDALSWRPASPDLAARLLVEVSRDSDDGLELGEDPHEIVQAWLADRELTALVHVGSLDGADVALVCASVAPDDGWATLTFMGLVPSARGRGLGPHVQRHGLAMLRAQGGRLYHGGTSLQNAPMRACFARLGCREWQRFRQVRWRLSARDAAPMD